MGDMDNADVAIIGGGVIGSAIACFLASNSDFSGRIVVLEPDPGYAEGSTARSVGGFRLQFSVPENIAISQFGAHFIKNAHRYLAVDGEIPDLAFRESGYLILASEAGVARLDQNLAVQHAHGVPTQRLDRTGLAARYPWLRVNDLAAGAIGPENEGWLDPYALLMAFRKKALSLDAEYRKARVTGFERAGARLIGARLEDGGTLSAGTFVNAAGPRAREVARMAGGDIPVHPRRRNVFMFDCRAELPGCPLVFDPCGLYFRPEGSGFITGLAPDPDDDPDCLDLEVDYDAFEQRLWPVLAHRVPGFEAIRPTGAWAGHYAVNTLDQNALLGPHPDCPDLILANGFSGHGLQQSPAVGRAISELIAYGEYRSLDLSRFGFERVITGAPLVETNIY